MIPFTGMGGLPVDGQVPILDSVSVNFIVGVLVDQLIAEECRRVCLLIAVCMRIRRTADTGWRDPDN
jgi:hypothetical protein